MEQSPGRAAYKPLRGSIRKRRPKPTKKLDRSDRTTRPTRETPAARKREEVARRDKRTERVFAKKVKEKVPEYASLRRVQESMDPREADRPYATNRDTLTASTITGGRTPATGRVTPPVERVEEKDDRPHPMILPGVGPVAQLTSQAAHKYGYTPEAYKELSRIPTTLRPPTEDWEKQLDSLGAYYTPAPKTLNPFDKEGDSITMLDRDGPPSPGLLAHEQAHGWWYRNKMNDPKYANEFKDRFDDWSKQRAPVGASPAPQMARTRMEELADLYPDTAKHPTELFAYSTQYSPDQSRDGWPDEIRPYYTGFLKGMDKLSTGEDTPEYDQNDWLRRPFSR